MLVTDVGLPDGDGIDHLASVFERFPSLQMIVLSAQNMLTTAARPTEAGADEYVPRPFNLDDLPVRRLARSGAPHPIRNPIFSARDDAALPLIGRWPAMQDVYRVIARVVSNDLTVRISGESGTGKELDAHVIHDLGSRREAPFVAINMAAIPCE